MTTLKVIALAGVTAGVLDLTASTLLFRSRGIGFQKLLQTIAAAALGPSSYSRGTASTALGLFFHFLIAFTATGVYFAASRSLTALTLHPWVFGALFGVAVHLFMTFVVIPLSATPRPFSALAFLTQLVIHILFVGLPIGLVVSRF